MDLALLEDRLEEGARLPLPAAARVVYVVGGRVAIDGAPLADNGAWHGVGACVIAAERAARLWRWELRAADDGREPTTSTVKLRRAIELPADGALMRADRVDFPPRGIAYTHTHQGPGIRVLLRGRFRVETEGRATVIGPGEPWFERGPDPVYAESIADEPTSFVRVMILPRALLGKSSIRYVKPEDQARPKSQTYTIFVDAPLPP
jgi:quercetin dioxygenase-like cupin family protein